MLVAYEAAEKWKEFADVLTQEVESIDADDVEARIEGLTHFVNVINQYLRQDAKVVAPMLKFQPTRATKLRWKLSAKNMRRCVNGQSWSNFYVRERMMPPAMSVSRRYA